MRYEELPPEVAERIVAIVQEHTDTELLALIVLVNDEKDAGAFGVNLCEAHGIEPMPLEELLRTGGMLMAELILERLEETGRLV